MSQRVIAVADVFKNASFYSSRRKAWQWAGNYQLKT